MHTDPPSDSQMSTRNRRWVVALIVLFPLTLFLVLSNGTPRFKTLPVYKQDSLAANGDSLPIIIPPFRFTDQAGRVYTADSLRGRIHIADFFFTNCPGICIALSKGMQELQSDLKDFPNVMLVSYSIDAVRDSVPALAAYARRYQTDYRRWRLLTGEPDALFRHSKDGYKLPAYRDARSPDDGIVHSNFYVLVDPDLRIRGFYDCVHPNENLAKQEKKRLLDELKVLVYEYHKPRTPA